MYGYSEASSWTAFPTDTTQRNFRFISTLGFACTLMSTWEIALMYVLFVEVAILTS